MEKKYKSLTIFEFQEQFKEDTDCLKYLSELKWKEGFVCSQCGHTHCCQAHGKPYGRQCTKCRHVESPMAGTLFHKCKFSLLKAFYIVYYVSGNKKGISSTELSRKLGLRQKTCWLFRQKVMRAMQSSGKYPLQGFVEVDETTAGGQEERVRGRKSINRKLMVLDIEHSGKGIGRMYGKVIPHASAKEIGGFMKAFTDKESKVKTDEWVSYKPLKGHFANLVQVPSGRKGENFSQMHRVIMGFKGWLRGMHHSVKYLQAYMDEYSYRFNRSAMKEGIFDNLLKRMVLAEPCPYKIIRN
ncbi:hypothetical protein EZS27_021776 [termite gut metagenome]|uniref:ISXO2-like transposase domain-containing protein n=1 Tax=termite gut metagenome TaxID=433724 RepID=A0A5J4R9L6_9ZZZZ